ncbi:prenyltransferase/squalene oxidase repeat-containing protein [Streptomyces beihaiensis]|uniref:Terpene cyclase/mutase family protein n=1 Tax=Streptomyces beihaiensis TaxID=2984495 RepID=A0ABT3TXT8_9ACTN|nr:hypothetical protein [Streptomyces beihaiensis]MCX3060880.1 hypothetical protein [Streptomyces beihaiensis]
MTQQQLNRNPPRQRPAPRPPARRGSAPQRLVGWLGGFGALAAAYAVFQGLYGLLPSGLSAEAARYAVATVGGVGAGAVVWLAAALLRARQAEQAARSGRSPLPPDDPGRLTALVSATYATLVDELCTVDDPATGRRLTGWTHSLGEPGRNRPTPVGTAYGLHLVLDLGMPDGRLSAGELARTLWALRLADGGWSARSQGTQARPEVTALVLGALARAGADPDRIAAEADLCTSGFTRELDRTGYELTHVVTTVLRGLLRAAPDDHERLSTLRDVLVAGAVPDPDRAGHPRWGNRLTTPNGPPSALYTAQAVVALDRAAHVLGETDEARTAREGGVRWLLACPGVHHDNCPDLTNSREEIRRPRTDEPFHTEVLNVRHFASSWVTRALLTPGAREVAHADGTERVRRRLVTGAAAAVWRGQTDGIWTWVRDGSTQLRRPIWMTYQGLSALRAHALWMYEP